MEKKIIVFESKREGVPTWYVSQSPNIMFSENREEAVVFDDRENLLEAIGNILFLRFPTKTMSITEI